MLEVFDLEGNLAYPAQFREVTITPNTSTPLIKDLAIETKDLFVVARLKNKKRLNKISYNYSSFPL